MEFSVEALELIQNTAKKSVDQRLLPVPNDPEKHLLLRNDGGYDWVTTPFVEQPRNHVVESIASFATAYANWGSGSPIWADLQNLKLVFFTDGDLRRSRVTMNLRLSPQFHTMRGFAAAKSLDQKTLVRMLRHDLADCVDAGVLAAFRSVDFQKMQNSRQTIDHSRQSLDADVSAQIVGEKKPEHFTVEFPLFATREITDSSRIRVTIDIDCDDRKFVLQAAPGHVDLAMDDAKDAVFTRLTNTLTELGYGEALILMGSP